MINTNSLERKWFLYKVKIFLPYAITVTSFTFISLILYIFLSTDMQKNGVIAQTISQPKQEREPFQKSMTTPTMPMKAPIIKKETIVKEIPKEELIQVLQQVVSKEMKNRAVPAIHADRYKESYTRLKPSLGFLEHISNNIDATEVKKQQAKPNNTTQITKTKKDTIQKKQTPKVVPMEQKKETQGITITKQDSYHEIKEVIKRFNKNKNPALSLFIAKKYYELGRYTKSYNYALATNELDNDIEDSWLIFAKSLVKLDEKEMAIKMLKKYINHSSSYRASTLLNEINSGKFK